MTITHRVASNPGDYQRAHALMDVEDFPDQKLGFPTILALEGDEVVGMMSTSIQDGMIVAGPLVLRSNKRRPFTALRLIEAYENAMRQMGISSFIFHTDKGSLIDKAVDRYLKIEPYAAEGGKRFFIWRLEANYGR